MDIRPGVWPTVLTPFSSAGSVDLLTYDRVCEYYLSHQSTGLFSLCNSSEAHFLTLHERIQLAEATVRMVGGEAVVAGALCHGELVDTIDLVNRLSQTGVAAVVVSTNQVAPEDASEAEIERGFDRLLAETAGIDLGLYECPKPFHRVLNPEMMRDLAATDRFVFHKDTSCDAGLIAAKLDAVSGSRMRFFNANIATLSRSIRDGADGYSGVGSNYFPRLYHLVCELACCQPERADQIGFFLVNAEQLICDPYPASGKVCLSLQGVPITRFCRAPSEPIGADLLRVMQDTMEQAEALEAAFAATVPEPRLRLTKALELARAEGI